MTDTYQCSSEGTKPEHLFNGVVVAYRTPTGEIKTVGPPGARTDGGHADLLDPHSALTAHGIRRWAWLELISVATYTTAVTAGKTWLAEQRAMYISNQG